MGILERSGEQLTRLLAEDTEFVARLEQYIADGLSIAGECQSRYRRLHLGIGSSSATPRQQIMGAMLMEIAQLVAHPGRKIPEAIQGAALSFAFAEQPELQAPLTRLKSND